MSKIRKSWNDKVLANPTIKDGVTKENIKEKLKEHKCIITYKMLNDSCKDIPKV